MTDISKQLDQSFVEELLGEAALDVRSNQLGVIDDKGLAKRATATRDRIMEMIDWLTPPRPEGKIDFEAAAKELMHFETHTGCIDCGTELTYSDWVQKIIQAALPSIVL